MLKKLKSIYQREQLNPSRTGILINPFFFAKRELVKALRFYSRFITGKVLDVGCGQKPYRECFKVDEYIGLEIDTPENRAAKKADFYYDGKRFPFEDRKFDCLIANEVLEHVFNPDEFLAEANRSLKPKGYFLISVPFVWDEHEKPHDYARYSSFGLKHLLEKSGFRIVGSRKTLNDVRLFFLLFFAYLYKVFYTNNGAVNAILTLLFLFPLALAGELLSYILPRNDDFYLDNVILAQKIDETC